ncbi:hypothetical protein BD779DRAFT_1483383 [Infundibulicybe gibba]|nr:hypothetical protein BD779DRAFT_1483383 [Infundibulicybe gibba]
MSAASRAEARRKAILSRGADRLTKLTTSARGEDAAFTHDDPPLPNLDDFVGEDGTIGMPTPRASPSPSPRPIRSRVPSSNDNGLRSRISSDNTPPFPTSVAPDSSVWTEEQQQQFMSALMGGPFPQADEQPGIARDSSLPDESGIPPMLAAMLQGNPLPSPPGQVHLDATAAPPTRLQKIMPFVHLVSMWALVAYFVFIREPGAYKEMGGLAGVGWGRWAELGRGGGGNRAVIAELAPFFWIFTTLQIILHSLRIFSGFDTVKPPTMLGFILPHLPPPFPSLILNGLKYMQMGSLFLDDIATLVVGFGFIVLVAGWFSPPTTLI